MLITFFRCPLILRAAPLIEKLELPVSTFYPPFPFNLFYINVCCFCSFQNVMDLYLLLLPVSYVILAFQMILLVPRRTSVCYYGNFVLFSRFHEAIEYMFIGHGLPYSGGAIGCSWTQWYFVISTTSTTNYTNGPIGLIELNPLKLLASSAKVPFPLSQQNRPKVLNSYFLVHLIVENEFKF
jgi:hypothetical protein